MPASVKYLQQLVAERQRQPAKMSIATVLAKWPKDQKFYAIEVLACDKKERKCKVLFEDGYECWMDASEIHLQLSMDDLKDELIVCCICDDGQSKTPNEIIMCDTCQQGYHLSCHKPVLDRDSCKLDDEEATWSCSTCDELLQMPDTGSAMEKPVFTKGNLQQAEISPAGKDANPKKSRAMKPKSLNSGSNGQKVKKTPKIKLSKKERVEIPTTTSLTQSLCD